jgi:flagellar basal-body rod modification protein FlgD
VSTTPPVSGDGANQQAYVNPKASLGKDDFLRLLVTQLRHQDPLNPMEDKDFMGQMAQFSSLEQMTNVSSSLDRLTFSGQLGQSVGLIGRTVSYETEDGTPASGTATAVSVLDGAIQITVGDDRVSPDSVRVVS